MTSLVPSTCVGLLGYRKNLEVYLGDMSQHIADLVRYHVFFEGTTDRFHGPLSVQGRYRFIDINGLIS